MSDQRVAFITGAAGDIGRATAVVLAERGWALAVTDHPTAEVTLARTAAECANAGAVVWSTSFDVTDDRSVADAVRRCGEELGVPDGLFNNAGIQGPFARVDEYPPGDARAIIDANIFGVFSVLSVVGAAMVATGRGGAMVCTASMAGVSGAPNMSVYSATKAAVIGLVRSAAKDLAPFGVRVNAISPAFIGPGRMWDNQVARQAGAASQYYANDPTVVAEQMISAIPMRRYGSLDEVARVVAFLLSDDASYITGSNLEVGGGAA